MYVWLEIYEFLSFTGAFTHTNIKLIKLTCSFVELTYIILCMAVGFHIIIICWIDNIVKDLLHSYIDFCNCISLSEIVLVRVGIC